jgi:acyl-CoA thioesterase
MAFKQTSAKLSIAHLICLIDTWAPAASSYYQQAVPLSTISWDLHFANPVDDIAGDQHLGYLNKLNYADSGVSSSNAVIWGPQGQLLAHSYQTNIIYG